MMEGVSGFSGHWLEILAAVYLVEWCCMAITEGLYGCVCQRWPW